MRQYVVYVASPSQSVAIKSAIVRVGGIALTEKGHEKGFLSEGFEVKHELLGAHILEIHLISDLAAISPFLRQNPADLLVYDERGKDGIEARQALRKIQSDFVALADLWGPDFLFPMSRVVAILGHEEGIDYGMGEKSKDFSTKPTNDAQRAFDLGRVQVHDVCVSPKSTLTVLRWLKRILTQNLERADRVGMAFSGGGIEGFLYQVGVMFALDRALAGKALSTANVFSGVSSGSICGSILAAGVPIVEVVKAIYQKSEVLPPLTSSVVFDLASKEMLNRWVGEGLQFDGFHPKKWIKKTLRSIPTGFFKGEALRDYFKKANNSVGLNDSFHEFKSELYIGATDQDTFEHVIFGKEPWKDIPVSDAIRASCALPPVYLPMKIRGRWFVDGQITKTCNLELLVERNCSLVIIIDPVKPLATSVPGTVDKQGGVYSIIQAIKALVYTRFHSTLMHLTDKYPHTDFLVFQPDEECAQLMSGSPMRYRIRTQLVELAYAQTLRQLKDRHRVYAAKLERYGFTLKHKNDLINIEKTDTAFFENLRS